ncbi:MAG: hypothetical protein U0Q19_09540 [Kineosporiaceae bacterium]
MVLAQGAPAVDQDPQHAELLVAHERPQAGHPHPDQGHRVRVGGVGLAALPGDGFHPGSGEDLRRDVHDVLHGLGQALGDVPADPGAALDRPDPLAPLGDVIAHLPEALDVGGEPPTAQDGLVGCHHLDRDRPLVRVHSDHHAAVVFVLTPGASVPRHNRVESEEGTAEPGRPLCRPLPLR